MSTFSLPIDSWTDATIRQIVSDEHAESLTVEFKRDLDFVKATDKLEVAKDISAMANSAGGWIIYGIDERVGAKGIKIAGAVSPLVATRTAPPDAAHWIDDVVAGNVTPRPHFRVRELPTAGGVFVIVMVTASSDDLHMLQDGRFYRRSEQAARKMTQPEVRDAYARIGHRREDAGRGVVRIAEAELVGPPAVGFLFALIPHTLREVFDPSGIQHNDPAIAGLNAIYLGHLKPFEDGLQSAPAPQYRFRIRRDGTISLFATHGAESWSPETALADLLSILLAARKIWPRVGIIEAATFAIRTRHPGPIAVDSGYGRSTLLRSDQSFEMPASAEDVHNSPVRVARAVMDRLFQSMGIERCGLFADDGAIHPLVLKDQQDLRTLLSKLAA